ncbi:MAG: ribosomal RNA small subunit methyltransferase A, partial [Actinomycetota bacterium]
MLRQVTPSIAIDLLQRHKLRAGRRHGQHFLVDPNTVRRIVRLAGVRAGDTILEIGPGLGSLTVALASGAARVVAVEIDATVAEALAEVVGGASNVEVVIGDALDVDLAQALGGPARLVANLPYNVATQVLLRVLDEVPEVKDGLVMVQREVGERWTAPPGSRAYGAV